MEPTRKLTFRLRADDPCPDPKPGDWIVSRGLRGFGTAYMVVEARRGRKGRTFALRVLKDKPTPEIISRASYWLKWDKRNRKR